jgi:DNA mismatch endonuclease (patch repair protein)
MPPRPSSDGVRLRMQSTAQRDTPCEVALRRAIYHLGLRYRVHWRLPESRRRADIAFPRQKLAVMVDGCFWHGCPLHGTWPKANARWWRDKILANKARDRDTDMRLEAAGWKVLRFWEHEDASKAATRVAATVRNLRRRRPR